MMQPAADQAAPPASRNQSAIVPNALASKDIDAHSGAARYYQPDVIPSENPETTLPSANDASKTYQGDISMRTMKVYVPPAESADQQKPAVAMNRAATPKTPEISEMKPATAPKPATPPKSVETADQLFERGEYRSALSKYRQQSRSDDPEVRSHSSLQAARCYAALGEPDRAEELLRKVMDGGNGRDRRTARKLLRNLR
jgi:FimV-like protein